MRPIGYADDPLKRLFMDEYSRGIISAEMNIFSIPDAWADEARELIGAKSDE